MARLLIALVVAAAASLAASGAGWAQKAPSCDLQAAYKCTDPAVMACQTNPPKGMTVAQCQMNAQEKCNTAANCPNSAR